MTGAATELAVPPVAVAAAREIGDARARPNLRWLSELLPGATSRIVLALREVGEADAIHRAVAEQHQEGGRRSYAQFRAPFELYTLIRVLRPEHVVETGVSSGVSSTYALLALRANGGGRLHSIDAPTFQRGDKPRRTESPVALPPGRTSGWAVPSELRRDWDLRIGPSQQLLPALVAELPSIGLFLHDSLHTPRHLEFELSTVRPRLTHGAVVLADNTVWTGRSFPRFARSVGARVCRRGHGDLVGLRLP